MQHDANKLDCFVRVITPENIEFEYALAGPFQRLPAFLFDLVIRAVALFGILVTLGFATSWLPIGGTLLSVASLLLFFALSWFYGIFFETRFNGRTLGKMVFKLRVISVDGRPINATQAALRNLLRLADMGVLLSLQIFDTEAPPFYAIPTLGIGLVAMTISPRMQRVGDLAAGTMVVSEQKRRTPWNMQPDDLRAFGLADLIPATFQVSSSMSQTIGLYMENRKRLSPARRNDVAKHLATPLIREFGLLPDTSPDLLLCALYVRVFLSEEQRFRGREQMRKTVTRPLPPPVRTAFVPQGTPPNVEAVSATVPQQDASDGSFPTPSTATQPSQMQSTESQPSGASPATDSASELN